MTPANDNENHRGTIGSVLLMVAANFLFLFLAVFLLVKMLHF